MSVTMRLGGWTPRARPVRIAALIELYERNFRLIECLAPELEFPFEDAVSYSSTDLPFDSSVYSVMSLTVWTYLKPGAWTGADVAAIASGHGAASSRGARSMWMSIAGAEMLPEWPRLWR